MGRLALYQALTSNHRAKTESHKGLNLQKHMILDLAMDSKTMDSKNSDMTSKKMKVSSVCSIFVPKMPYAYEDSKSCSSGSEHEPSSVCLAAMVEDFFDDGFEPRKIAPPSVRSGSSKSDDIMQELAQILQEHVACDRKFEELTMHIQKGMKFLADNSDAKEGNDQRYLRGLMNFLRNLHYNAAVCKSRWICAGSMPEGKYAYIDVLMEDQSERQRVIVDPEFKAQFEIAKPTEEYSKMLEKLPRVYVGGKSRLKEIIKLMCEGAKISLKERGLYVPPWRKSDYMAAKWCAGYRRTINTVQEKKDFSMERIRTELGFGLDECNQADKTKYVVDKKAATNRRLKYAGLAMAFYSSSSASANLLTVAHG